MGTMQDHDPGETQEWVDALSAVTHYQGADRARYLLGKLVTHFDRYLGPGGKERPAS